MKIKWMIVLLLVLAVLATIFFSYQRKLVDQTAFRFMTVKTTTVVHNVVIAGVLRPQRTALIVAPYSGYIKKLFVHLGQKIQTNDPIVSIVENLQSQEAVYPMRVPFSGTVVSVPKSEGEYVKQGDESDYIVRIDDLRKFYVESNVAEIEIPNIKVGQKAVLKVIPITNRIYHGTVKSVSLAPRKMTNETTEAAFYRVTIEVLDQDSQMKSGMSVRSDILLGAPKNLFVLPHEFIGREDNKYYVIMKGGSKEPITIGEQSASGVEIKSGVKENDIVQQIVVTSK